MNSLQETNLLKFHPNTLETVRKWFGLEKPGDMSRAVDILEEWVKKQDHFIKKDFSRSYLELSIIGAKGSLERAKARLNRLCTFKTLMPQYFGHFDIKNDFKELDGVLNVAILPTLTDEHVRMGILKLKGNKFDSTICFHMARIMFMGSEYYRAYEYSNYFTLIIDLTEIDMAALLPKLNLVEFHRCWRIYLEGYGGRVKSLHLASSSKLLDTLVNIFKQVARGKIKERIYSHRNIESLYEVVPKDLLPSEYGGKEKSVIELHNNLIEEFNSKRIREYMNEMSKAGTDESHRHVTVFNEQYMGMPGTFRTLTVD